MPLILAFVLLGGLVVMSKKRSSSPTPPVVAAPPVPIDPATDFGPPNVGTRTWQTTPPDDCQYGIESEEDGVDSKTGQKYYRYRCKLPPNYNEQRTANTIAAVAASALAGANAGAALDVLLGGQSGGVTNVVATVGGAAIGGSIALVAAGIITAPVAIAVAAVAVVVYALSSFITDEVRKAVGTDWAIDEFFKTWDNTYRQAFAVYRADPANARLSDGDLNRILYPFIDGYMMHLNNLALDKWMARPHGLFGLGINASPDQHRSFGKLRGYFIEPMVVAENLLRSNQRGFVEQYVPLSERKQTTFTTTVYQQIYDRRVTGSGRTPSSRIEEVAEVARTIKLNGVAVPVESKLSRTITKYEDVRGHQFKTVGRLLCNTKQYVDWMQRKADIASEVERAATGRQQGVYQGTVNTDGSLTFEEKSFYWKNLV